MTRDATTGMPIAWASSTAIGMPSPRLVNSSADAVASRRCSSSGGNQPDTSTLSPSRTVSDRPRRASNHGRRVALGDDLGHLGEHVRGLRRGDPAHVGEPGPLRLGCPLRSPEPIDVDGVDQDRGPCPGKGPPGDGLLGRGVEHQPTPGDHPGELQRPQRRPLRPPTSGRRRRRRRAGCRSCARDGASAARPSGPADPSARSAGGRRRTSRCAAREQRANQVDQPLGREPVRPPLDLDAAAPSAPGCQPRRVSRGAARRRRPLGRTADPRSAGARWSSPRSAHPTNWRR